VAHIQTFHDLYRLALRSGVVMLNVLIGLILFAVGVNLLVTVLRAFGRGGSSHAADARAHIEAEMRHHAALRAERVATPADGDPERALRRKLASAATIERESPFEGERTAAREARERLMAQLHATRPDAAAVDDPPPGDAPADTPTPE